MRAPNVRCGGLLVWSAVLRVRPRRERHVHLGFSYPVAPNDPTDPNGVNRPLLVLDLSDAVPGW